VNLGRSLRESLFQLLLRVPRVDCGWLEVNRYLEFLIPSSAGHRPTALHPDLQYQPQRILNDSQASQAYVTEPGALYPVAPIGLVQEAEIVSVLEVLDLHTLFSLLFDRTFEALSERRYVSCRFEPLNCWLQASLVSPHHSLCKGRNPSNLSHQIGSGRLGT
jgi:hypothetical protein